MCGSPEKPARRVSFESTATAVASGAGSLKRKEVELDNVRAKKRTRSAEGHERIALHGLESSIKEAEEEMREAIALRKQAELMLERADRRRQLLFASRSTLLESMDA